MADGTEQRDRHPSALSPDYFQVDETRLGPLAAMSAGLAAHLRFHGEAATTAPTWASLFEADELLVLATILGYDTTPLRRELLDDSEALAPRRLAQGALKLASVLDGWYKRLHAMDSDGARAVSGTIAALAHRHLADDMVWIGGRFAPAGWRGELSAPAGARLHAIWFEPGPVGRPRRGRSERELLRAALSGLFDAVRRVQQVAAEAVPVSRASQRHEPAAGLFAAFLALYQNVQRHVNGFTGRHTDFYYRDVLDMQPRAAEPDRVHIVCQPVPGAGVRSIVPAGTRFAAGKDAQQRPLEFVSEADLVLTDARVAALHTLRLERGTLRLQGEGSFECVKRIVADAPGAVAAAAGAPPPFWSLFGGSLGLGAATQQDAALGWAVASPLLWLKEGQREIALTLKLRDLAGDGLWHRMAQGSSLVQWQFVRALPQLFRIRLTTAAGWWEADDCNVSRLPALADGHERVEIRVRLRPEAPAIVGCVPALHGASWGTVLPLMRLQVRQDVALCAYSLLDQLQWDELGIAVRVTGARDLVLGNQLGRLDPSMPFTPFGPMAMPGDYLVFGAAEAASKPLTRLRLHLQWGNLPQELGGFAEHYAAYDSDFSDGRFLAAASVLQEGQWRSLPVDAQGRPVFTLGPGGRLTPDGTVAFDPATLQAFFKPVAPPAPGQPFVYDVRSRAGFFRWELRAPQAGFGHQEYARVLARIVSANARRKEPLPLPNPPYTPVVERVTLDYEAAATVSLGGKGQPQSVPTELFHIHPFGLERIHPGAPGPRTVLPLWPEDGNLHIGLAGTDPQGTLSLLFELRGEVAEPRLVRTARIRWSYLAGNRWHELPPGRVLADTTGGFVTSGIVTLDLPAGLDLQSTVMPAGLYWLRLSASADFDSFAAVYSVRAQALCAVRAPESALPLAYEALPPGSITGPAASVPGLAKAQQVGASFGLRPRESDGQLKVRTGERLKHKNRAWLPWDIERMVLERFPSVFKVRCFPHLDSRDPRAASPGDVLVVIVPALSGEEAAKDVPGPRLNAIELSRIQAFLAGQATPFARIVVRNASYERVQVRCAVAWKHGSNAGWCERLLNQSLFDHLSPWNDQGHRAHFDWMLRREHVEAHIRSLPYVEFVTGVSLLHVAASDAGLYSLDDTARPGGAAQWEPREDVADGLSEARARWPWSIAVPMRRHLIQTLGHAHGSGPDATGVGRLAIGGTFVVGQAA